MPYKVSLGKPTGKIDKVAVNVQFDTDDPAGFSVYPPAQGLTIERQKLAPASGSTPVRVTGRVKDRAG